MICINTYTCVWFLIEVEIYNFETMISLKYMAVGQSERVCVCFMFYREREFVF